MHLAPAGVTGSESLTPDVADIRTRLDRCLDAIRLLEPDLEHSNSRHGEIVGAVPAGDADGARSAVPEHIEGTASLVRACLS